MPKLLVRPTPVPHQIKVVQFLTEIAVFLGRVVAIERSFLGPAPFAPDHAVPPRCPSPHRSPHPQPVLGVQMLLIALPPSHEPRLSDRNRRSSRVSIRLIEKY